MVCPGSGRCRTRLEATDPSALRRDRLLSSSGETEPLSAAKVAGGGAGSGGDSAASSSLPAASSSIMVGAEVLFDSCYALSVGSISLLSLPSDQGYTTILLY